MKYAINTVTQEIKEFEIDDFNKISKNFRTGDWREATQGEVDASPFLLQEAQDSAITQLASNRETLAKNSTVTLDGNTYANSQNAREAITWRVVTMDDIASSSYFTYPDKKMVHLTKADFQSLGDVIATNESTLRETESGLITDINNCTTIAEVEAIDITLI